MVPEAKDLPIVRLVAVLAILISTVGDCRIFPAIEVNLNSPTPPRNPVNGKNVTTSRDRTLVRHRRWVLVILAAVLSAAPMIGCRAIVKYGESRQSIAARRLSRQGLTAAKQGDWQSAETLFSEALDVSGNNDAAHRGLAETLWQRGQTEDALKHLRQAVQLSAGDPKHLQRLGRMYLELGRVDEAARQCEIALQSNREWAEVWALWGDCEAARNNPESALAAYHRALSLQPAYPYAKIQAAEIYHQQGRHDRLLATLDRFQQDGSDVAIRNQSDGRIVAGRPDLLRGLAMREIGRYEEANRFLMAAARKNPTDVTARLQLAASAISSGQTSTAQAWLGEAMQIDPEAVAASGWVRTGIQDPRSRNSLAMENAAVIDAAFEDEFSSADYSGGTPMSLPGFSTPNERIAITPDGYDDLQ